MDFQKLSAVNGSSSKRVVSRAEWCGGIAHGPRGLMRIDPEAGRFRGWGSRRMRCKRISAFDPKRPFDWPVILAITA